VLPTVRLRVLLVLLSLASGVLPSHAAVAEQPAAGAAPSSRALATTGIDDPWSAGTDRLVVLPRPAAGEGRGTADVHRGAGARPDRSQASRRAEVARTRAQELTGRRATLAADLGDGRRVLELDGEIDTADAEEVARRLVADGVVAEAEVDRRVTVTGAPDDPRYPEQWHLHGRFSGNAAHGIDIEPAWALTRGSEDVVVAVLDTGVLAHPDIVDRLVPGYDFVDDDGDATDPGDWCEQRGSSSSWHGTHVAGTVGASAGNGVGVAGVDQRASIQPVRVVGACGGSQSDIARGIRWAAGVEVPGVPTNPTPADVINLSLGAVDRCTSSMQSAVDDAVGAGVVLVAAAGNNAEDAAGFSPANCADVLTVAATSPVGDRAYYSNHGAVVDLAAPGGDFSYGNPDAGVLSLSNRGTTTADPDGMGYAHRQGTSMAAPHVAGVVSLLLALEPTLSVDQVRTLLRVTAADFAVSSPFGTDFVCSSDRTDPLHCGTGIVNAAAAVAAVAAGGADAGDPLPDEPDEGAPEAPTLEAVLVDGRAELSWSPVEHVDGIDAYELYESTSASCDRSDETRYRGTATSHTATDLEGGVVHRYCVVAIAGGGAVSELSNIAEVTPPPPPAPTFPTDAVMGFDLTGEGHVRLTWPAAEGRVDGYEILRDGVPLTATADRGVTLRDLAVGERHRLDVRAVNRGGTSEALQRWVAPVEGFADVPAGSTFAQDVRWMATGEITRGCGEGRFCPTSGVTRQQMAAFVVRALGLTETSDLTFSDVPASSPFAADIDRLASAGITLGCGKDSFCPAATVTRQQMAAFVVRALDLTETSGLRFDDVPRGSTFETHIDRLATARVTLGCGGDRFCPTETVTRQQMAAFLRRALVD
jgi:hypothetical protein